ncbi:MAG: type IV secretion IcmS family protein [Gammaproteobacteria bacterium]
MSVAIDPESLVPELSAVSEMLGTRFTFKNQPISYERVFANNGLLPAIMRRAEQLCTFCFTYGLGLTFERSEAALAGVVLQMDDVIPKSLRILCALDVLIELIQQSPNSEIVALDQLAND